VESVAVVYGEKKTKSPDETLFATTITFVNVGENGIKSPIK